MFSYKARKRQVLLTVYSHVYWTVAQISFDMKHLKDRTKIVTCSLFHSFICVFFPYWFLAKPAGGTLKIGSVILYIHECSCVKV